MVFKFAHFLAFLHWERYSVYHIVRYRPQILSCQKCMIPFTNTSDLTGIFAIVFFLKHVFNPLLGSIYPLLLWRSDDKWRRTSWSTLVQAITSVLTYRQISNIRSTSIENNVIDHSDVVGASPVGAAPTTSSLWTQHLAAMDWAKTTARRNDTYFSFEIRWVLY